MFSRFFGKTKVVPTTVPDTSEYFDISEDIKNLVNSKKYNQYDKPDIFKDILKDIDTFIIEKGPIKPIGKFKKFEKEEGEEFYGNEGKVTYTDYYVIFSRNEETDDDKKTDGNKETDSDKKTDGNEETKGNEKTDGDKKTEITIYTTHPFDKAVLPKFYISNKDIDEYNKLKKSNNITGGKPKTRRNIRKRQKKYSRKNRIKSRRNRLMK